MGIPSPPSIHVSGDTVSKNVRRPEANSSHDWKLRPNHAVCSNFYTTERHMHVWTMQWCGSSRLKSVMRAQLTTFGPLRIVGRFVSAFIHCLPSTLTLRGADEAAVAWCTATSSSAARRRFISVIKLDVQSFWQFLFERQNLG